MRQRIFTEGRVGLQDGYVHNADSKQVGLSYNMREDMGKAQTAEEMHAAIGFDCWVVVPIHSPWHSDETLEGTRLTLVGHMPTHWCMNMCCVGYSSCIALLGVLSTLCVVYKACLFHLEDIRHRGHDLMLRIIAIAILPQMLHLHLGTELAPLGGIASINVGLCYHVAGTDKRPARCI